MTIKKLIAKIEEFQKKTPRNILNCKILRKLLMPRAAETR